MNMSECWKDFIDQKIVTVDNLLIWGVINTLNLVILL